MLQAPLVLDPNGVEIIEATEILAPLTVTAEPELSTVDQLLLKFTPGEVTVQARVNEGVSILVPFTIDESRIDYLIFWKMSQNLFYSIDI